MVYDEGEVKDIAERLRKEKITKKEALEEMKKRGLYHHADDAIPGFFAIIGIIAYAFFCFLPVICKFLNQNIGDIPSTVIPDEITFLLFLFAIAMTPFLFYPSYLRKKMGGTGHEDETILIVKKGAYRIVRHPNVLAGLVWFILLPVIFSHFTTEVPFTVLSVFGEVALVTCFYLQILHEEKFNIRKWGDGYKQYMREVPRFNLIKGLWNLREKR